MDLVKVLAQLRDELENLDAAIFSLERLQHEGGARKRGRPPKALSELRKAARAGLDAGRGNGHEHPDEPDRAPESPPAPEEP
jgi:hypothetical protein